MNISRNKNLRVLLLISLLIISSSVMTFGQKTIIGKIYNENTKEAIPFANIGVVNSNVGTLSNLDGSFSIIIPINLSNDSLTFSSLGYNRKVMSLRQLASGKEYSLSLTEKATLLQTVLITSKKLKVKTIELGNKNFNSGNYEPDTVYAGRAVALLIDPKTLLNHSTVLSYLKNAKLYIYNNNFNLFKFRIRLNKYDSLTGKPGEDLLEKSIVKESSIKGGWLTFDLSQFNFQVKGPFFITFEQLLDLDDRKTIANGYQRIQILHPEWLVTDTIVFEGKKQIKHRLETKGNLSSVPGTFIGTSFSKRIIKRNSCFVRTTSLGEWKKAPMTIAGTVTLSSFAFSQSLNPKMDKLAEKLDLLAIKSPFAFSQSLNPSMDKLVEKLDLLAIKSPLELIYLQTNKDIYETGEDLWFKANILDSHSFIPSLSSKTLYIQLIDEKTGLSLWNEKYEIQKGFSDGHLFLAENLAEGDYLLTAYTGNTFFKDSTASTAFCKITVKKDMKPKITVTHDFNRFYYRPNDSIKVTCRVLTEYGEIPPHAAIQATLKRGDKKLGLATFQTNPKGEATVIFPPQKSGEGLLIDMKVKYSIREVSLSIPVPCKKGSPIQFDVFPEGGNLVSELPSRLAFKAVDIDGAPLDVEGTLFEDDSPLLEFKSSHAGMGSMMIIPLADKKYQIILSKPKTDSIFLLPKVYPEGIVMRLGKRDDKFLELFVSQNSGSAKRTVYLRGQVRGAVYCSASGVLSDELKFKVPLDQFPMQGIAEFTLFDENLEPMAERLVYIKPDKKLYIETTLSKQKYETREKASLKIKVKDENGEPVKANLGVSVFDKLYYNPENPKNILTYFFLTSQLKGNIYDPAYYFDTRNKERDGALDLLLLTQGWRRYLWSEDNLKVYGTTKQLIFDETRGEVYDSIYKVKPLKGVFVKAYNPESNGVAVKLMTDSSGILNVSPQQFKKGQGGYIYLSPLKLNKEQVDYNNLNPANISDEFLKISLKIGLTDPFQTINETRINKGINYPISRPKPLKIKSDSISPFLGNHSAIKLPEFVVKGRGVQVFRDKYIGYLDSLAKAQTSDYVVFWGESKYCQCLNLPGYEFDPITIKPDEGKGNFRVIKIKPVEGEYYRRMGIGNVKYGGVGYNGMNIGALISYFQDYRPVIYHYPKYTEEELLKKYNLSRVKGYYAHREFYQPNYDKVTDENLIADYRNTLLWAPSVVTNDKGEATLEFFCSDVNYNFVGRVEGVSGTGLLGNKEFDFTVKRTINFK